MSAGIRSLAVSFPRAVRDNDWFRARAPELVARVEREANATPWALGGDAPLSAFDREMGRYLGDPFRGTRARRVLSDGQTARDFSVDAARRALDAARLVPHDIDLAIVSAFLPESIGIGEAAFLARDLGLRGAAWNLETACASGVVALDTACAMIESGRCENVLVVTSCNYSRHVEDTNVLAWTVGDGAGAFVVSKRESDAGVLGTSTIHTADTCDTFFFELAESAPNVRLGSYAGAGRILRESSERHLRTCCEGAAKRASMALADVDFFVFNTPVAWFAAFAASALGIDPSRTVDAYPLCANVGPVLPIANLHLAARERKLSRGDVVLVYGIGSVSSASAVVMRWDDVAVAEGGW